MRNKQHQYWLICVHDGLDTVYQEKISINCIGERKLMSLLKALTAKASLSEEEIIDSYVNKNTKRFRDNLLVQRLSGKKQVLSCGTNPYATAELV